MKWHRAKAVDDEVTAAAQSAAKSQIRIERAEETVDRLLKERTIVDQASRDNGRRWKTHREENGWNEIALENILSIWKDKR